MLTASATSQAAELLSWHGRVTVPAGDNARCSDSMTSLGRGGASAGTGTDRARVLSAGPKLRNAHGPPLDIDQGEDLEPARPR